MGDKTGISWCDHTHNVWIGCTKVSEGCKLCYAERDNERYHWTDEWGPQGTRHKTKSNNLGRWNKEYWLACKACGWRGEMTTAPECPQCGKPALKPTRQRVFVNSLSDLFEDHAAVFDWRNEFFALSQVYNNLDFLLLTKRPENIGRFAPRDWTRLGWPTNIWLGVSVENQARADERLPELVKHQALRWISVEPMLDAADLRRWLPPGITGLRPSVHWVVVGGESGLNCRPMKVDWVRELLRQCQAAGVPFFMKQLGGHPDRRERVETFPRDLQVQEWPVVLNHEGHEVTKRQMP